MQGLVYLFIVLTGLGLAATGYFGLAFTPIEAGLLGLLVTLSGLFIHERALRRRAETRLEKAIEDLSRLLSTDAQAGQVLSQRVKSLVDLDLGSRLDVLEADISVLGTVVRQVAEAVSEIETEQATGIRATKGADGRAGEADTDRPAQPRIPLATVQALLEKGQLVHHTQSIVTLPQRRLHAYELVPRLRLEDGSLADPPDYMPYRIHDGATVVRRVDRICAEQAVLIVRRARLIGDGVTLLVPMTGRTLESESGVEQLITLLAGNRAVNPDIMLALDFADWDALDARQIDALDRIVQQGVGLAIRNTRSLRLDFAKLAARGVRMIGVDTTTFLTSPEKLSDFHSADINDYIKRFGIALCMESVRTERQILDLLDDGIGLAQGPGIAKPGPIRHDLRENDDDDDDLRQAASR